ncbi:MAG: aminotransferase, partial [Acidimicrobiia bacterium]
LDLQEHFLDSAPELGRLVVDDSVRRANFVAIETPDAGELYQGLHDHKVITDYRGERLRIGFGVYQDSDDVDRLIGRLEAIVGS